MFISPGSRQQRNNEIEFPRGTAMLFINATAPPGWVRVTTNDDALLRIVGSATPGTGGSNGFVAVFNSQTQTGTGTSGSTTLSIANLAAHTHTQTNAGTTNNATVCGGSGASTTGGNTGSTGTGTGHTHTIPALSITTSIKYVDSLVAKKK